MKKSFKICLGRSEARTAVQIAMEDFESVCMFAEVVDMCTARLGQSYRF